MHLIEEEDSPPDEPALDWTLRDDMDTIPPGQGEGAFRFFCHRLDVPYPRVCRTQLSENGICALGEQSS